MAFQIPFPLPSAGIAKNSKIRINLDAIADAINGILVGTTSYDALTLGTANSITGTLTFYNSSNAFFLKIQPGVTGSDTTYTLPITLPGSTPGVLTSDTSGVMSWKTTFNIWSLGTSATTAGALIYYNASNSNTLTLTSGVTASTINYTLPAAVPTNGVTGEQILMVTYPNIMHWSEFEWNVSTTNDGLLYYKDASTNYIAKLVNTIGSTGFVSTTTTGTPAVFDLLGTSNQITVAKNVADFTLSLPQSINTSASVTFGTLTVGFGSVGSESILLGSGPSIGGICADSGAFKFTLGGTTYGTIDGGGNYTAAGLLIGQGLRLEETGVGTDYIAIVTPASIAATYTLTLPVDDGGSSQVLTTDGAGVLSWTTPSGTGANTALSNLASVAINTTLVSDTDNTDDLGTSSINWKDAYIKGSIKTGSTTFLTFGSTMTAGTALAMGTNKITGLGNGTAAQDAVAFTQIKYIQAPVQGTKITTFTTTSSTYQATGLSASITPTSASNRIKITVSITTLDTASETAAFGYLTVKRGTTDLSNSGNGFVTVASGSTETVGTLVVQDVFGAHFSYIDSPATTSATTYEVFLKNDDNSTTARINLTTGTCSIILEEVV